MAEESKKKRGRPKGAGRQKGSNETAIVDPIIAPYKIYMDSNQFTVTDLNKKSETDIDKNYGYFTSLGYALIKIVKLKLNHNNKQYTLDSYIKEYNKMLKEFLDKIKI